MPLTPSITQFDVNGNPIGVNTNPLAVQVSGSIGVFTQGAQLVSGSISVYTQGAQLISGTVSLASQGSTGAAVPTSALLMGVSDGTNMISLRGKAASTAALSTDPALVVSVSPNTIVSSSVPDNVSTGALGALNAAVTLNMAGLNGVSMQLAAGTLIGVLVAEVSVDGGTTWVGTYFDDAVTGQKKNAIQYTASNTATTQAIILNAGTGQVRIRVSAYTSGTANCTVRGSMALDPSLLYAVMSGSVSPPTTAMVGGVEQSVGGGIIRQLRVDGNSLRTTSEMIMFQDAIEGSTINPWIRQLTNSQTIAQSSCIITLNNGSLTTASSYSIITTIKQFQKLPRTPISLRFKARLTSNTAGQHIVSEMGFSSINSATANISNGCCFRWRVDGTLAAVVAVGGTETVVQVLAQGVISTSAYYMYDVTIHDDYVRFVMSSATTAAPLVDMIIPALSTNQNLFLLSHLPSYARLYVDATGGGTAAKLLISEHIVHMLDTTHNKPWADQMSGVNRYGSVNPTTYAQNCQLANAAAPAAQTPSNTTAPYTTLGGEYLVNATAGAETMLTIFGFTIPNPYVFNLTGIRIQLPVVLGAAVGTRTNLQWFVVHGASSANLSSATNAIRIPLSGLQTVAAAAAIGAVFTGEAVEFYPKQPITCLSQTVLHVGYKCWSGAATASLQFRGTVFIDGYFEL